jgi:hypothetical protein
MSDREVAAYHACAVMLAVRLNVQAVIEKTIQQRKAKCPTKILLPKYQPSATHEKHDVLEFLRLIVMKFEESWARPGLWPGTALVDPNGPTGARLKPVSALTGDDPLVKQEKWQARPGLAGLACR